MVRSTLQCVPSLTSKTAASASAGLASEPGPCDRTPDRFMDLTVDAPDPLVLGVLVLVLVLVDSGDSRTFPLPPSAKPLNH